MTTKTKDPIRTFQSAVGERLRHIRAAGEMVGRDGSEWRDRVTSLVETAAKAERELTLSEAASVAAAAYMAATDTF